MAVRLRLRREGTKKKPHFRIVATDHRSPRDGRFIEIIGDYHPMENPSVVNVDEERALHWLTVGATPSSQVENLLRITGVWEKFRPGDTARPEHTEQVKRSKKARAKAEEPAADEPAADEPAAGTPAAEEPAAEDPAAEAPDTEAAATEEPAGESTDEGDEEERE